MSGESNQLVIFPGALGDLVCFLPALRELARRGPATVSCAEFLRPLVEATGLAATWAIESREASWLFSVDAPEAAASFYGAFSSVDSFSGWSSEVVSANLGRWVGSRGRVHPFLPARPMHLASHFLAAVDGNPCDVLAFRSSFPGWEGRSLNRHASIAVHPGSGGKNKRWSRDGFARVLASAGNAGYASVVLLGPAERDERPYWEGTAGRVSEPASVLDLGRELASSSVYLGNDSGPSHLAGVLGTPGVALFGPTDPACWRPLSQRLDALRLVNWSPVGERASDDSVLEVSAALEKRHLDIEKSRA